MSELPEYDAGRLSVSGSQLRVSVLRGLLVLLGVAGLVVAALWIFALAYLLSDSNHPLAAYERRSLTILAAVGIASLGLAAGSAFTYATTTRKIWIAGVLTGAAFAIPVLVVWIELGDVFGGSD